MGINYSYQSFWVPTELSLKTIVLINLMTHIPNHMDIRSGE